MSKLGCWVRPIVLFGLLVPLMGQVGECWLFPPPPQGACCVNGECSEMTEAECNAAQGQYHGDGSECGAVACPPQGACCVNGECSEMTEAACSAAQGQYHGDGSQCGAVGCPPPTTPTTPPTTPPAKGACCVNGQCSEMTEAACSAAQGQYLGDGSQCGADACPTSWRGSFTLTWQHQSATFGTESDEASGRVEFSHLIELAECSDFTTSAPPLVGPCTIYTARETMENGSSLISNWHAESPDGVTRTQVGGGTAKVSYGFLFIKPGEAVDGSGQVVQVAQVAIQLGVNGDITANECFPRTGCSTRERGAFAGFGTVPPQVFVAAGPDPGRLEGTASDTHTLGTSDTTQTATLTWSLTRY